MQLFGRPFRPRLWPTLTALPVFLVLIGLGTWQAQRMGEKEAEIATLQARWQAPPIELPQDFSDPEALQFHRVELTGRFLNDKEFYLPGKSYKATHGLYVATPFLLDDGRSVIVNRGWVPDKYKQPESRQAGLFQDRVTIEGILRIGGWKSRDFVKPENDPAKNVWYYFDLPAMAAVAGLQQPVTAMYVEALGDESTGILPIGLPFRVDIPNDHLQYAITWYLLAVALLVIYLAFHLKRKPDGA